MIHSSHNYSIFGKGACTDQCVGTIRFRNNVFSYNTKYQRFDLRRMNNPNGLTRKVVNYSKPTLANNRKIVVLLESPHIDEYNVSNQSYNTAPAWGSTGNRFNSQFIKVINNNIANGNIAANTFISNTDYDVYFVNAIQYQCSLGRKPINKKIRDTLFEILWNIQPNSFKDDLFERLSLIKPDVVINACTVNVKNSCLNNNGAIRNFVTSIGAKYLDSSSHMSCWCKKTTVQ